MSEQLDFFLQAENVQQPKEIVGNECQDLRDWHYMNSRNIALRALVNIQRRKFLYDKFKENPK